MHGNIKDSASNIADVFADDTTPIMVNAACLALQNGISNLTSSYRQQIDELKQNWHKDDNKFVFRSKYKQ